MKKTALFIFLFFQFIIISAYFTMPKGLKKIKIDGKEINEKNPHYKKIIIQTDIAIQKLLECELIPNSIKYNISHGLKKWEWDFKQNSDDDCGGLEENGVISIWYVNKNYLEDNWGNKETCCYKNNKVKLWQTLGHELAHLYVTIDPSYSKEAVQISECQAYYIEETCLKTIISPLTPECWKSGISKKICDDLFNKYKFPFYLPDNPDDNYSNFSGNFSCDNEQFSGYLLDLDKDFSWNSFHPKVAILNETRSELLERFLENMNVDFIKINSSESINSAHKILFIGTSNFFGLENDLVLKTNLDHYVKNGGTVIVLAQQHGTHYEKVVPLPEGSSLSALGWREDQSCFWGSAYHKTMNNVPHPVFSGVASETVSVGVDGYFSIVPTEATVLLRRKLNQEPVMISYPYGEGTVILTSLFSDFANAHSQMSGVDEAHIIRDLLTYARDVKRDIPSWRLTNNQAMAISLPEVDIKNDSETAATKAKFRVLSPNRKRVLYTVEQSIFIDPQTSGSVALEFSFTPTGIYEDIIRSWIGIYHVEFELYDVVVNHIQTAVMNNSGQLVA